MAKIYNDEVLYRMIDSLVEANSFLIEANRNLDFGYTKLNEKIKSVTKKIIIEDLTKEIEESKKVIEDINGLVSDIDSIDLGLSIPANLNSTIPLDNVLGMSTSSSTEPYNFANELQLMSQYDANQYEQIFLELGLTEEEMAEVLKYIEAGDTYMIILFYYKYYNKKEIEKKEEEIESKSDEIEELEEQRESLETQRGTVYYPIDGEVYTITIGGEDKTFSSSEEAKAFLDGSITEIDSRIEELNNDIYTLNAEIRECRINLQTESNEIEFQQLYIEYFNNPDLIATKFLEEILIYANDKGIDLKTCSIEDVFQVAGWYCLENQETGFDWILIIEYLRENNSNFENKSDIEIIDMFYGEYLIWASKEIFQGTTALEDLERILTIDYKYMSAEEKRVFSYIYETQGRDEAYKLMNALEIRSYNAILGTELGYQKFEFILSQPGKIAECLTAYITGGTEGLRLWFDNNYSLVTGDYTMTVNDYEIQTIQYLLQVVVASYAEVTEEDLIELEKNGVITPEQHQEISDMMSHTNVPVRYYDILVVRGDITREQAEEFATYMSQIDGGEKYARYVLTNFYSAGISSGNMVPSILLSTIPGMKWAGLLAMFTSCAGGTYREQMRSGSYYEQAMLAGLANGAMEVATETMMGGIMGLSSGVPNLASWATLTFKEKLITLLITSPLSEMKEETVQLIMGDFVQSIITGEPYVFTEKVSQLPDVLISTYISTVGLNSSMYGSDLILSVDGTIVSFTSEEIASFVNPDGSIDGQGFLAMVEQRRQTNSSPSQNLSFNVAETQNSEVETILPTENNADTTESIDGQDSVTVLEQREQTNNSPSQNLSFNVAETQNSEVETILPTENNVDTTESSNSKTETFDYDAEEQMSVNNNSISFNDNMIEKNKRTVNNNLVSFVNNMVKKIKMNLTNKQQLNNRHQMFIDVRKFFEQVPREYDEIVRNYLAENADNIEQKVQIIQQEELPDIISDSIRYALNSYYGISSYNLDELYSFSQYVPIEEIFKEASLRDFIQRCGFENIVEFNRRNNMILDRSYGSHTLLQKMAKYANVIYQKVGSNKYLDIFSKYGEAILEMLSYTVTYKLEEFVSQISGDDYEQQINKYIYDMLVKSKCIRFDLRTLPQSFKSEHPELFLAENAPAELKEVLYNYPSNRPLTFEILKQHKNWIPCLEGKNVLLFLQQSGVGISGLEQLFEKYGEQEALIIGMKNPSSVMQMLIENQFDVLTAWYDKHTYVPPHFVMKEFPVERSDSFVGSRKKWEQIMSIDRHNIDEYSKTVLLKASMCFGVFDDDMAGFKKIMQLFSGIPEKLSSQDMQKMIDFIQKQISSLGDNPNSEMVEAYNKQLELIQQCYMQSEEGIFSLKIDSQRNKDAVQTLRSIMEDANVSTILTPDKAHKLFGAFEMKYEPTFRDFILKHMDTILSSDEYISYISSMQKQWSEIRAENSNLVLTLNLAMEFVKPSSYTNVQTGNIILAKKVSNRGYNQQAFERLQQIYNYAKMRVFSTIPRVHFETEEYICEMLRLDDPMALVIGKLTNCCQELGNAAESCMTHSAVDKTGRVFYIKDKEGRPIAQSWVWRNKNVLCFDNIEIPIKAFINAGKNGISREQLTDTIYALYQRAAQELMEKDKVEFKELLAKGKITEEQYEALKLGKVTVGIGYNDIAESLMRNAVKDSGKLVDPLPYISPIDQSHYLYNDDHIKGQYIVAGDQDVITSDYEVPAIYSDEFVIHDNGNTKLLDLLMLQSLERATKGDIYSVRSQSDETEKIVSDIAYNYGLNPETTRIIMNANFAIIYDTTDEEIIVGDVLYNTSFDNNGQQIDISDKVAMQIRMAMEQIGVKDKEFNIDSLSQEQREMFNKARNLTTEIDKERGL
ncbi:MAG: hypothetical protein PUD59_03215 [bacterium]|nr:hypothetical protein [bacterium]